MMISTLIPVIMFDILENPWGLDASSLFNFQDETRESVGLTDQTMKLGYESTNSVQNLQSIFVMLNIYFFKVGIVIVLKTIYHYTGLFDEYAT